MPNILCENYSNRKKKPTPRTHKMVVDKDRTDDFLLVDPGQKIKLNLMQFEYLGVWH